MSSSSNSHAILNNAHRSVSHPEGPSHKGRLVALHTRTAVQASLKTVDAYIAEIPLKAANDVLKTIDSAIPQHNVVNLQHLRRFAKPEFLPIHLRDTPSPVPRQGKRVWEPASDKIEDPIVDERDGVQSKKAPDAGGCQSQPVLHLLVCVTSIICQEDLLKIISSTAPFSESHLRPYVRIIPVPLLPPTSNEHAKLWSQDYWPTVYKKNNPFGPHPSIVFRSESEIRPFAGTWMALAKSAGVEVSDGRVGEPIGAVVVDPTGSGSPLAVGVAGDARWRRDVGFERQGSGNVIAHAVMRAIGMVCSKRRTVAGEQQATPSPNLFEEQPLTATEHAVNSQHTMKPGGYLCVGLDIYVTHEPCVMCSMAILHSRFSRVIFGRRMPLTGGLTSETGEASGGGRGYALFWIHELNWKLLAWEWIDEMEEHARERKLNDDVHA